VNVKFITNFYQA